MIWTKEQPQAEMLVQVGELSAARQAFEGAEFAPGNQATLNALNEDPARRPLRPREALTPDLFAHTPTVICVRREGELLGDRQG